MRKPVFVGQPCMLCSDFLRHKWVYHPGESKCQKEKDTWLMGKLELKDLRNFPFPKELIQWNNEVFGIPTQKENKKDGKD